jgi:hypothetical protein
MMPSVRRSQSIDVSAAFGFTSSGRSYSAVSACKTSSSNKDEYCYVAGSGIDGEGNVAYVTYTMVDSGKCGDSVTSNGAEVVSIAQDDCKGDPPNDNSGRLRSGV